MNINSLVNDWAWRTNDGMPDPKNRDHIELLEEILVANKYDRDFIDNFIKQIAPLNESAIKNQAVIEAIKAKGRTKYFNSFLKNLPGGDPARKMKAYLENLDPTKAKAFAEILWSSSNPPKKVGGSIEQEIFNLNASGIGLGELWLAVMVKNSEIQGGGVSFDLKVGGKQYEVKDYSGDNAAPIRLGVEGALGNFPVWTHILKTIDVVVKLNESVDLKGYFDADFADVVKKIAAAASHNRKGEWPAKHEKLFRKFYSIAQQKTKTAVDGFNRIDLRGPNQSPISMRIKPIKDISGKITVEPVRDQGSKDSVLMGIINELRRLQYVREGTSALDRDLQSAVDQAIKNGPAQAFIVFRPGGRIYFGNKFKYKSISQGGIKIVER